MFDIPMKYIHIFSIKIFSLCYGRLSNVMLQAGRPIQDPILGLEIYQRVQHFYRRKDINSKSWLLFVISHRNKTNLCIIA